MLTSTREGFAVRHAVSLLLVLAAPAFAAPVPKALKKRPDAEVFVGTWELAEYDGRAADPKRRHTWTFGPDLTMWSKVVGTPGEGTKWVVKIDPVQSPKHFDIGDQFKGIYQFDGDDILVVYGNDRPTGFDEKERRHFSLLRRVQEGK